MFRSRRFDLGSTGEVSGAVALPDAERRRLTAVLLGHGAGNDMNSPLLSAVHAGLAAAGYPAVKFNFPYKERGRRVPDPAPVLEECWRRVIDAVRTDPDVQSRRLVIGGKSLGGRIASHVAAQGADVAGLVFLGYPLHPPGQTARLRAAHLGQIRVPMLFFTGTRDPLCDLGLLRAVLAELQAPVRLHVIEGGDHSFKLPRAARRGEIEVQAEIVDATVTWLNDNIEQASQCN